MRKTVVIIGALDTKGIEFAYIKGLIEAAGLNTLTIHTGVLGPAFYLPEVSNEEIATLGGADLQHLISTQDRGLAVETMMNGAIAKVIELHNKGQIDGIIGLGGSAGTTIGAAAMRSLPIGIPKVMVTTMASGNTRPYVGMKDVTLFNSIVDISGLNRISRQMLANAANALIGMVQGQALLADIDKPLIATTMFGVTTPCVDKARSYLEEQGFEVLVFHGTGIGGQTMEHLIAAGFFAGVLDITTSELADDVAGGLLSAGPTRLTMAGQFGIPQVVSLGALDMANFGPLETVPEQLRTRQLHQHNPNITLMRTNIAENKRLGELIASKLNRYPDRVSLYIPLKGVSALDKEGQPFNGPQEDAALFQALREKLDPRIELVELDNHINDEEFALQMAKKLVFLINNQTI
ncbi:UPF0261 family protein [Paenibacillus psychroresistens]|uniref:UPF0261 family protein n=1 Tax=Paenibacillus psychroresistens TaxID=1778678 RepID=A0A6B8RGL3_9BACL|nr:Tm-1-like ATP-binding domain-containing protein [Paenibacillus psychroresistens]QGQ95077.1 UPF0261 family protein [Paenibacillus psychroresistens]